MFRTSSFAQVSPPQFLSPNTEALLKFSEIPVSNYTGVVGVSVPLGSFDLSVKNIDISIDYNASGIKDTDMPTWVGLGWSLKVGGAIVRSVKGYPDDYVNGNFTFSDFVRSNLPLASGSWSSAFNINTDYDIYNSSSFFSCLDYSGNETVDTQYDIYHYSFNEFSGKFTFDNNGNILKLSHDNLKIEYQPNKTFKVTDGNGLVYLFATAETRNVTGRNGGEYPYVSSWYLTSITNSVNQDKISFVYKQLYQYQSGTSSFNYYNYSDRVKIFDDSKAERRVYINGIDVLEFYWGEPATWQRYVLSTFGQHSTPASEAFSINQYLSKIIHNKDTVHFYSHSDPSDLLMRTFLDSIKVVNDQKKVSDVKFSFGSFEGYKIVNFLGNSQIEGLSKLSSVQVNGKTYSFDYYETLHGKSLFHNLNQAIGYKVGKDFWGYYNGEDYEPEDPFFKVYNSSRLSETGQAELYSYGLQYRNSAFRNPDAKYAQLRSLKKVRYPTGGSAEFEYEGNTYSYVGYAPNGFQENVRNDDAMQLQLDSLVSRTISSVSTTSGSDYKTKEFTVHEDQTVGINHIIGFPTNSAQLTWADYNAYVQYQSAGIFGRCTIYKFNSVTNSFDLQVFQREFDLVTAIGSPVNEDHFQQLLRNTVSGGTISLSLGEGRYKMESFIVGPASFQSNLTVSYKFAYKKGDIFNSGGIRIKNIKYTDQNNVVKSKHYTYDWDSGASSGVLETPIDLVFPSLMGFQNITTAGYLLGGMEAKERALFFNVNYTGNVNVQSHSGVHVGYARVTEWEEGNGRTVYHYTSGKIPAVNLASHLGDVYSVRQYLSYPIRTNLQTDYSSLRGLLTQKELYDENGTIKSRQHLSYNMSPLTDRSSVALLLPIKAIYQKIRGELYGNDLVFFGKGQLEPEFITTFPYYPVLLKDSTVNYFGTELSRTVTGYQYSLAQHSGPIAVTRTASDGSIARTEYKYATDFLTDNIYNKMAVDHNMVSPVIEELQYKGNKLVSGNFNGYKNWNGVIAPEYVSKKYGSGGYEVELTVNKYDGLFNPSGIVKKNGSSEVYLWSYGDQYPIVKIINASYIQVEAVLGSSTISNFSQKYSPTLQEIKTFVAPLKNNLPQAQVYIYTYQPLVGMTSKTDPRGITEYYQYDSFQRLREVLDFDSNILRNYQYNYKP
ncbi:hypothetical protein [Sphingobacterium sp. LRF_L2]|uniref:hypothetical protein n=1 Tax=Sphingobacterium sp. LRF_L2 TaxID=3369421 RepID=UPI003F5E8B70